MLRDLPGVGENFQDHAIVPVEAKTQGPVSVVGEDRMPRGALHMLRYLWDRRGLLSSNMVEAGGFVDVSGAGRPDVQLHFMPGYNAAKGVVQLEGHGVMYSVCVLRPKSRGTVRLRSSNASARPEFRSGVLSHPRIWSCPCADCAWACHCWISPPCAPFWATASAPRRAS